MTEVAVPDVPDLTTHSTWNELIEATVQGLKDTGPPSAEDYQMQKGIFCRNLKLIVFLTNTNC